MNINSNEFNTQYDSIQKNFIKNTYEEILIKRIDKIVAKTNIEGFVTKEPISYSRRLEGEFKKYSIGDKWGDIFDCGWFKLTGEIKDFDNKINYELKLDLSGEAVLYDKNGSPLKGFTNGSSAFDFNLGYPGKLYANINELIDDNGKFVLWIEAGANDLFGNLSSEGKIITSEIVVRDYRMLKLYYDIETLYSTLIALPIKNDTYYKLFDLLLKVSYDIVYENKGWLEKSLESINGFYIKNKKSDFLITAVGHSHMDLAWLWPIRETRRKIGRFISNMIYLIDQYDDFIFGISQPQQIKWLKEDYPILYNRFKQKVAEGRIELQGAMWVESDTNVPGEESLVRQMLYGHNFYKKEFNKEVKSLWLPDVFGYNGNMPQIIKKSGLDYFMTIKISWSLINEFPYHSFKWKGIDGTSVLTHMPPEGTYNSPASPRFFIDAKKKYKEINVAPIALSAYGIGDGGGGPGIEHVERLLRQNKIPDIPSVEFGSSEHFFDKLDKYQDVLPTYEGELYLENHQGTYTSQSNIKRFNHMMEQRLKTLETLLVLTRNKSMYCDKLNDIWEEVLLYQFHDILPGSSIKRVYDEAIKRYEVLLKEINLIIKEVTKVDTNSEAVFNPLITQVNKIFKNNDEYKRYIIEPLKSALPTKKFKYDIEIDNNVIETESLLIKFNSDTGQIESLVTKNNNFELICNKKGNELLVYKDLGDAWNIEIHYREQEATPMELISHQTKKYGEIIERINHYRFKESTLIETIVIDLATSDIIFNHELDWKNVGYMLRTSFPLNIVSDKATFDIQFGSLERSTLNDNSINKAQFEVSGQQWVNIQDEANSFSVLTKNKYGYHVKNNIIDINLLRSTNSPCKDGDIGKTKYSYQLLIGERDLSNVDDKALILNSFFPIVSSDLILEEIIKIDNKKITYSALKYGFNDSDIYLRLYNRTSEKTEAKIQVNLKNYLLYETNLIEEKGQLIDNLINFDKFEIKTIKITKKMN